MSYRPRLVLVLSLLVLVSLTLSACNRERPATTATTTTPAAARGTVAVPATASAGTQAAPATVTGPASALATPSAPAPQQVVVSPAPAAGGTTQSFTYTVVTGDTLATIATRFGTTQDAIAQLNGLTDPNALLPGQKLQIPGTGAAVQGAGGATGGTTTGDAGGSAATGGGAPTAGGTTTYTVQQGDTLGSIARRFSTTVAELQRLNNIPDPDKLALGQKLVVPAGASGSVAVPTTGQGKSYVVQRGDTLLSIARRFGLTVKQLQDANNISNPDRIYPGQKLIIP